MRQRIGKLAMKCSALVLASISPVWAADLLLAPSEYQQSDICYGFSYEHAQEQQGEVKELIAMFFPEANDVVVGAQTGFLPQLKFDWALETRDWCGVAQGYLKDSVWDTEAVNRCLCFHRYMREF